MKNLQTVQFSLGDAHYSVNADDVGPETTLNTYLREKAFLTGTKKMCLEGGCGSCLVAVEEVKGNKRHVFVVNSCLVSILSCHRWKIHTIEGIGNPLIGLHPIQKILADNNGTQCGFCSAGMVMNMFALNESGPKTKAEIENSFGGNLCRCTGYRPILTAFKKLASDADEVADIEDTRPCLQNGSCAQKCKTPCTRGKLKDLCIELGDSKWLKVHNLKDLMQILRLNENYKLIAGNTSRGVYRNEALPNVYIDVSDVAELIGFSVDDNSLTLGGNLSLTATMDIFQQVSEQKPQFAYLSVMRSHIDLIASVPVRNIGTLAGNLMIKNKHNEFPSDLFLILETFNAILVIVDTDDNEILSTPKDFVKLNMDKKVIRSIVLNALPTNKTFKYLSYKIMPRAQNTHCIVNAGFLLELNDQIINSARIVYGGIGPDFIHATRTENLIKGQTLFDNNLMRKAFRSLDQEIHPIFIEEEPSPLYRKNLAISLFYKFILNVAPDALTTARNRSGGTLIQRPVSTGVQQFGTQKSKWPLTEPVPKIEARAQTSGQAQYIDDIPDQPNQLYAAFVTADAIANSEIVSIDASAALKLDGVVAFYDKKDIPGNNTYTPKLMGPMLPIQEELFCSGRVQYYHQPVGIIVANDQDLAWKAADLVEVNCTAPTTSPFLNVKDVVNDNISDRIHHQTTFLPKSKGDDVKKVVKGEFYIGSQYHFHMEVQCCSVIPTEDGLDVYPATQWVDLCQVAITEAVKVPMNKINVHVRRLGGAFGGKILKNAWLSTAAALAAVKLNAPVKMWLPLEKNMDIVGGRIPLYAKYEVGVDDKGVIQYLTTDMYSDIGIGGNEFIIYGWISNLFENCYDIDRWEFSTYSVNTDTASTTWTRAPGTVEGLATIESIMEHIGRSLDMDPFDVKMANLNSTKFPKILSYWKDMHTWADIENRKEAIKSYNAVNRWKKRGMSLVPMVWTFDLVGQFTVLVAVFHAGGGVIIAHGGIEMGQGINTKAAQMCAYKFGISLDQVTVKPTCNVNSANSGITGGSFTSEAICYAVSKACDDILAKMKPVKEKMTNPTWEEVVEQCYLSNIQLTSTGFIADSFPEVKSYPIFGLCAAEVEVDILTGQKQILQVDIIEDLGESDSPLVDIGQIEGAFVMGIGYYTTEELIHNSDGKLLTNRSWNYKPPGAKDIPINFRIKFPENDPNTLGLLKSKAVAEPPICLSVAVPLAIRDAIASARKDADSSIPGWVPFDGCTTIEATFLQSSNNYQQYTL